AVVRELQRVIERPAAGTDTRQTEAGGDQHQVVLEAAVAIPEAVFAVDRRDRRDHHRDDAGSSDRHEPAEQQQETTAKFAQSGDHGVGTSGPQAHGVELSGGASLTTAAKDSEQFLGAVAHEQQPNHQTENEESNAHALGTTHG